jgi:hypothetical protein
MRIKKLILSKIWILPMFPELKCSETQFELEFENPVMMMIFLLLLCSSLNLSCPVLFMLVLTL